MTESQKTTLAEIAKHFDTLEDPRCHINRHYPLTSVVVIAIMAILAGANGPTAIAKWARAKHQFLHQGLSLPDGVPCKDVFRNVLTLLNPKVFQACFADWLTSLRLNAMKELEIDQLIYNVDGKTHRRSHDHAKGWTTLIWTTWTSTAIQVNGPSAAPKGEVQFRLHRRMLPLAP